jgi:hypothetical protein
MQNTKQAFIKSIDLFKKMRIKTLEAEYSQKKRDEISNEQIDEQFENLAKLIGDENKSLLIEHADTLVARYSSGSSYYYDNGFRDCYELIKLSKDTYKGLMDLPPLNNDDTIDVSELL